MREIELSMVHLGLLGPFGHVQMTRVALSCMLTALTFSAKTWRPGKLYLDYHPNHINLQIPRLTSNHIPLGKHNEVTISPTSPRPAHLISQHPAQSRPNSILRSTNHRITMPFYHPRCRDSFGATTQQFSRAADSNGLTRPCPQTYQP